MKSLCVLAGLLALPFTVNAQILTPAKILNVKSPDGLTAIKDIKATLTVSCIYRAGIFWPESRSCGSSTQELKVENGAISIPQVETFNKANIHAQFAKNYQISLSVYEGSTYLANLTAYNGDAFKALAKNTRDLNILRFKGAKFNVAVEGQDFFGSELAQDKDAYLFFSVTSSAKENKLDDLLISSSLTHYLWSAENKNLYIGKEALKDLKEISMKDTILAYLGEEKDLSLKINLRYSINSGVQAVKFQTNVAVPATPTALSEIGTIDLKAVK